jgi:hypothetical protein
MGGRRKSLSVHFAAPLSIRQRVQVQEVPHPATHFRTHQGASGRIGRPETGSRRGGHLSSTHWACHWCGWRLVWATSSGLPGPCGRPRLDGNPTSPIARDLPQILLAPLDLALILDALATPTAAPPLAFPRAEQSDTSKYTPEKLLAGPLAFPLLPLRATAERAEKRGRKAV